MSSLSWVLSICLLASVYSFQVPRLRHHSRSSLQMATSFTKYQGLGNDFLLIDNLASGSPLLSSEASVKACNRNFGVGGDGVIFVCPGKEGCDYEMRIYNSDGTEPEMCGNGIRCMARFIHEKIEKLPKTEEKTYRIWTGAGEIIPVVRNDGQIVVDMGYPILETSEVPTMIVGTQDIEIKDPSNEGKSMVTAKAAVDSPLNLSVGISEIQNIYTYGITAVSMGNPHAVTFVDDLENMTPMPFETLGPMIERHMLFPEKCNVEFVQKVTSNHVLMKVWERGAGPTLACGTGACATVVAGVLTNNCDLDTKVTLPGGDLQIFWDREESGKVFMTGPAEAVFEGELP